MPYFITKDIINKSVLNIFSDAKLNLNDVGLINQDLINLSFRAPEDENFCERIKTLTFKDSSLFEFSDMLFQLKDYKYYLSYVLKILINSCHYNDIAKFMSRIFVNHIGDCNYVSKDENYDFSERYFDRFVEAVKYSEIDNFKIMPFLFYIYYSKSDEPCNKFLRPSKEFLKGLISNNEATFLKFINTAEYYKAGYIIYADLFANKGAQKIIENLISENYFSKDDLYEIFITYKSVCLPELKNYIIKQTGEKQKQALNFYLSFATDVKSSLPELYSELKDENLKAIIKDEIELSKNVKFETIKDFIDFVDLNLEIEEEKGIATKYLMYFKNGVKVSDKVLTHIFNTFKNILSPSVINKYSYLKEFFPETELNTLGKNLLLTLDNKITYDTKWIVALICSLCSHEVVNKIITMCPTFIGNSELSSYVLGCLVETNSPQVINLIKQLYLESNNKNTYYSFLETLAKNNSVSALDYLDEMVSNFGLDDNATKQIVCNGENLQFKIDDNLSVKVKNLSNNTYVNLSNPNFVDTADALKYFNDLTIEVRKQIENFNLAYKTKRTWSIATFEANVLSNPILNKIASTLVWGVYDKDKLIKVYNSVNDVYNESNPQTKIALVHPVELIDSGVQVNKFEPFKQLNKQVFVANNYNYSNTFTTEFNGVAVNEISFNAKLRALGYKMSVGEDVYYFKMLETENVFVKVEINNLNTKNICVVGNVKFYNLSLVQRVNNKFILPQVPEQIGSVNKRVYSDVLNDVYEACYN